MTAIAEGSDSRLSVTFDNYKNKTQYANWR